MNITWLGQAGLLFETGNMSVMMDPYFSNCCVKLQASSFFIYCYVAISYKVKKSDIYCFYSKCLYITFFYYIYHVNVNLSIFIVC